MPILFSAVACDKVVLNKFATCDGNFSEIVEEVVTKIPDRNNKMTYSHGRFLLHYIKEESSFYFCITDRSCQRSRAFLFLNEVRRRHKRNKKNFSNILAQEIYRYNEDYATVVIQNGELEEVNSIGVDSSDSLLGEKMLLIENGQNLQYTTITYTDASPQNVAIFTKIKSPNFGIIIIGIFMGLLFICLLPLQSYYYVLIVIIVIFYTLKRYQCLK